MYRKFILCLLGLLVLNSAMADLLNNSAMNNLTNRDGLAGIAVSSIISDRVGRIWMATSNGVSSFNGKVVNSYRMSNVDIPLNFCFDITADDKDNIYVATRGGLFVLYKGESEFRPFVYNIKSAEAVLAVNDTIYIGSNDGFYLYVKRKLRKIFVNEYSSKICDVSCIKQDIHGDILFSSNNVIYKYNPHTHAIKSICFKTISGINKFDIINNKIFIGTKNHGLCVSDIRGRRLKNISDVGNVVTSVQVDDNNVYVGTDGAGAFVIDAFSLNIKKHFGVDENGIYHLPHNAVYCFYHDKKGNEWFGINRYGICYLFHKFNLFSVYKYKDFTTSGIEVRSYLVDNNIRIIGTFLGFYYIDEVKGVVRYFSPKEIGANIITCVIKYDDMYFIGTYDGGLLRLNPKTMSISRVSNDERLKYLTVSNLITSPDDHLWASTYGGIFVLDKEGHVVNYNKDNSDIKGALATSLEFGENGNGWISCSEGMCLYVASKNIIRSDVFPPDFFNNKKWLKLIKGHGGMIYAYGTNNNIYFTNQSMNKFGNINLPNEIIYESCNSFYDDCIGHYWIGSDRGLFSMDYKINDVIHFGFGEGLNSFYIGPQSISLDKKGCLWVGTSDGLMKMSYNDFKKWKREQVYKVIPYNVTVNGYKVKSGTENTFIYNRNITINWNFVSQELQLSPILIDYARQEDRFYQYKIDNDNVWSLVRDGENISIKSLSPGKHNIVMRLSGISGTETKYSVYVVPSFLFYFEVLVVVLALCLLFLWNSYRLRTNVLLEERDTIEQTLMEEETARQKEEMSLDNFGCDDNDKHKVKVNVKDAQVIIVNLNEYMEKERPYLNPDLKMSDIASVLKVSQSLLSVVFSQYLNENYYDYINTYRLKEFKEYIYDGTYKHFTLTALSEKCGFKKTSFFTTFRKVEGLTPAEFIQKHKK